MDNLEQKYTPEKVQNQTFPKVENPKSGIGEKFAQVKETVKRWTQKGVEWFKNLRQTAEVSPDLALATIASTNDDILRTLSEEQEVSAENNEPQDWLDRGKEKRYHKFVNRLQKIHEKGGNAAVQEWFSKTLNYYGKNGSQISPEDLSSLELEFFESQAISAIAGEKIIRPVISLHDKRQLQKVAEHLGTNDADRLAGLHFHANHGVMKNMGVLITQDNNLFKEHEMFHSIDPYVGKRVGYDRVIGELFAYYEDLNRSGPAKWDKMIGQLVADDDIYYSQFTNDGKQRGKKELTREQYESLCKQAIHVFQSLEQRHGSIEARRQIVQQKTLNDLFRLA